ncbi:hypothetical protein ACFPN7_12025 [Amycolatopsis halotolerans]|uniref:hypothetical protein n=1 Tax=Amycolatopsis halotolerans TaxID=330083 RepID=UPI0036120E4A
MARTAGGLAQRTWPAVVYRPTGTGTIQQALGCGVTVYGTAGAVNGAWTCSMETRGGKHLFTGNMSGDWVNPSPRSRRSSKASSAPLEPSGPRLDNPSADPAPGSADSRSATDCRAAIGKVAVVVAAGTAGAGNLELAAGDGDHSAIGPDLE